MEKLKPCPFCGDKARIKRTACGNCNNGRFYEKYKAGCEKCGIYFERMSEFHTEGGQPVFDKNGYEDAIEAWNRRAGEEP